MNVYFFILSIQALGHNQPPTPCIFGALSLGVKLPIYEAEHTLPVGSEVKKTCVLTATAQYIFLA
jgi:hypothetical protein